MRDVIRGIVIGLVVLALLGAIASRAGWLVTAIPRPGGTAPWVLARATGFTAFVALALDVIFGLLVSTRTGDRWIGRAPAIELHGWLSPVALALVSGHALVLLADSYIRFDLVDLAVPFASSYRPLAVGLGVIAAYLAVVVHVSFGLRRRLGTKLWRRLHALSFVAFVAASVHAIAAGSDSRTPWAVALYATPLGLVLALVVYRVARRRRPAPRRPELV